MAGVVVRCPHEPDSVAVLQVLVSEPIERAVPGLNLHQSLHRAIAVGPVSRLVGMGYDQHVVRVVAPLQPLVQFVQQRSLLVRHARTSRGIAEKHVVVAAV